MKRQPRSSPATDDIEIGDMPRDRSEVEQLLPPMALPLKDVQEGEDAQEQQQQQQQQHQEQEEEEYEEQEEGEQEREQEQEVMNSEVKRAVCPTFIHFHTL